MIRLKVLILVFLFSCTQKQNNLIVDLQLDNSFFQSDIAVSYFKTDNLQGILSYRITDKNKTIHKLYTNWSIFFNIEENDTLLLKFSFWDNSEIRFKVFNNLYDVNVSYSTDLQGTYPDGNKYGTFFEPELKSEKFVLNGSKFNIGDTVKGYFKCVTGSFRYKEELISKEYEGYFVFVIQNPDSIRKYSFDYSN